MSLDLNFDELGTLAQMVEERAKSELSSVLSRLQSAAIGEASTLLSEGLSIVGKWEALHAKVQAAVAPAAPASEPSPAPEPAAEAASAPAEEPPASEPAPVEEQPTEQLPAVEAPTQEAAPAQ